jgi:alpha-1,4-galacturonosyltransferase
LLDFRIQKIIVFHLVTDQQNFYAFKSWFSGKSYKGASFRILNIEDFQFLYTDCSFDAQKLSPSEEFCISFHDTKNAQAERTEYLSVFGYPHLPFLTFLRIFQRW